MLRFAAAVLAVAATTPTPAEKGFARLSEALASPAVVNNDLWSFVSYAAPPFCEMKSAGFASASSFLILSPETSALSMQAPAGVALT